MERVGGDLVEVTVLLPPGQSPATYEPTPKQVVKLSTARVYFRIGLPFEERVVDKVGSVFAHLNIVDTREGIDLREMTEPQQAKVPKGDHTRLPETGGGHKHGQLDPHIWLNPRLVKVQAGTICRELCRLDPAHRSTYEGNLRAFQADLDRVDRDIAARLAPLRGRELFVFHPAYGYFTDAYGLRQVAVESGGKAPTARQLSGLIRRAKQAGVRVIFVQPQFDKRNAEAVAKAVGGVIVPLDPLAEDYINNLLEMTAKIERALGREQDQPD